jgi:selenocysteine-specific elongation factor
VDVHFHLLPDASGKLQHASEVKLFIGTTETIARTRLLGMETLDPGQEGWLQLELRQPITAVQGDRYILRQPSPGETLGGGIIVDPHPKRRHKRFDETVIKSLEAMALGSPADILIQASVALGPAPIRDVIQKARLDAGQADSALAEAIREGRLLALEDGAPSAASDILVTTQESWQATKSQIEQTVDTYHKAYPLRSGMPREELKSRVKAQPRLFNAAIKKLVKEALLAEQGASVSRPGHTIHFDSAQQARNQALLRKFAQNPYATPSVKECQAEVGEEVLAALIELDELVAVSAEVIFRKQDYETMVKLVRDAIRQRGQVTLAEVRDLFGTTRKYVQAFLEHLDAAGVTMRQGDYRKLR